MTPRDAPRPELPWLASAPAVATPRMDRVAGAVLGAAILEGANTPGGSDSIATIAGALVGARAGLSALPTSWVRDVERSTLLLRLAAAV